MPNARITGTVTLAAGGDSIDLNSALPNFGSGADRVRKDTLQFANGVLTSPWDVDVLELPEGEASYETCAVATGYAPTKTIEPHRLDGRVCIRLQSGKYARIAVNASEEARVELTVTTWDAPL